MTQTNIFAELVKGTQRVHRVSALFGINFPFRLEPTVYSMASNLAPTYTGGYWDLFTLSNHGFLHGTGFGRTFQGLFNERL